MIYNDSYIEFKTRIDNVVEKYNNKTAFTYLRNDGTKSLVSFSDIGLFIKSAEKVIYEMGLRRGDRVGLISPHSPYAVFLGITLAYHGMTIVPFDATLPQEEIEKLFMFAEVRALFVVQSIYDCFDKSIVTDIPCFRIADELAITPYEKNNAICTISTMTKDPEMDVIAILFSSGTTGQMKGIKGTYTSVLLARDVFERLSGLEDYMTYLLVLPFNHIAGFTGAMTYFLTGCELGFIEEPDASKLGTALMEFQPYYFAMVPKVYEVIREKIIAVIKEKGKVASTLVFSMMKIAGLLRRTVGINVGKKMFKSITSSVFGENIFGIGTGASPCKKDTAEFFLNLGLEWSNLYATTETSVPIVATGIFDRYPNNTVGNVNAHPEIRIRINNANVDGIGEIVVNSKLMMKGYFRRDDLTVAAFDEKGYFLTGDYGYIDKKGYLHITGRVKDSVVLKNGKKVSPDDVDRYYMSLIPNVKLASRGFENKKEMCDELHIFVETDGYMYDELDRISERLNIESKKAPSMYKISGIHFVDKIPKTSVGKVKRYLLEFDNNIEKKSINDQYDSSSDINERILNLLRTYTGSIDIMPSFKLSADLGFDSLTLFEITSELEKIIGLDISTCINSETTVEELIEISSNTVDIRHGEFPQPKTPQMVNYLKKWIRFSKKHYIIDVEGIENIPQKEGYIICSNHASYFDPIWILTAMGNKADLNGICCMAAVHTMKGRTSRRIFDSLGGIPVDREGNTIPSMSYAKNCLKKGRSVIVFPEGARSRDGSMLPFKNGSAELAIALERLIIPVKIEGAFDIFPRTISHPRLYDYKNHRKYSLRIVFGKPIYPHGSASEIMDLLKKSISSL
ncbi:MAG: AMP-binding protein [Eubacterium sp.]|nr:AMP-binding protein [Eubacterium sp.]